MILLGTLGLVGLTGFFLCLLYQNVPSVKYWVLNLGIALMVLGVGLGVIVLVVTIGARLFVAIDAAIPEIAEFLNGQMVQLTGISR